MIFKPQFSEGGILQEYPRPQKKRNSYINLNGEWDYAFSRSKNFTESFDGKIIVPYSPESPLSKVSRQLKKDEFLHLRKTFTLPDNFNRGRVFLNVGACDQVCEVFLNGKFLYKNNDGYTSFTVELTNVQNCENVLYLIVTDDSDSDVYGRGKQKYKRGGIWYTAISGIWQTCFLESTPNVYVKDFKYYIDFDNKKLSVNVDIEGDGKDEKSAYVSIIRDDGSVIEAKTADKKAVLDVSGLTPWSPENPQLYIVKLKCGEDEVESYFGLRKFSKTLINGKLYFAINDKPVFLNGLLDQGYYGDGIYTPAKNKDLYDELFALKSMGFNMLRKHIKKESMLWYYYCDVLGIVVFQDMINGGGKYSPVKIALGAFINLRINDSDYKSVKRDNPLSRKQYVYEANRLIDQLFNVTSLFLWTPFNEGWGQFDAYENWVEFAKKDPTRLYDHASGWQDKGGGDVNSKHIYFKKINAVGDGKRVLAVTEFGGYSLYVKGHVNSNKKFGYRSFNSQKALENAYAKLYKNEIIPCIRKQGLSSCCYTQVSDVEDEINGLYTYDRVLKVDADFIKSVNEEVYKAFEKSVKE